MSYKYSSSSMECTVSCKKHRKNFVVCDMKVLET